MIDITGSKIGRLRVIKLADRRDWKNRRAHWVVQCECGSDPFVLSSDNLLRARSKSCGCLRKEMKPALKHGMSNTAEYRAWSSMIQRCINPNNSGYNHYGGRGIRVHPDWFNFLRFYEDVGPKPYPEYSLDRINTDGHYEPGNVQWSTKSWQTKNQRRYAHYRR